MAETVLIAEEVKTCCATLYESDWVRLLLGDSLHPGGLALTERLGELLGIQASWRVLDVAAGQGTSAIFLAQRFGCQVVGVDYSAGLVAEANAQAASAGLTDRVRFEQADAEALHFADGTFDALVCECAFCTFPDKPAAAREFARVLRAGGRAGLSDLTRSGPLPRELNGLLAWIACIADARPIDEYVAHLAEAGFAIDLVESHDAALTTLVHDVRSRLLTAELLVKLKKLDLPGADFNQAKQLARSAARAVQQGRLGYALIVGTRG
ncbi:MAG: class I SAM-dependent methyltransferase [Chloroflexi bacterium]|nr:MAG: class I SAM-dependent methyltransferase [Chloroflexota bacterium]